MIAYRLLFFALPAILLTLLQLNIPWHMILGGGGGGTPVENFSGALPQENDDDDGSKKNSDAGSKENSDDGSKKKDGDRGSSRDCLVAFDGPSTMTSNEEIDRIPAESMRMHKAVVAYQRKCRRQNEWASNLIQRRNMEDLALACEQKRREEERSEQIYRR